MRDLSKSRQMMFGKHKDKWTHTLPLTYLLWALSQDWMREKYPGIAKAIAHELCHRFADGDPFDATGLV